MTVVLKVNIENIECEMIVYVNVTYDCSSQSRGKCLRKYYICECCSQSKYWKSWVRWMFM
jgi:hypothetical protein